MGLSLWVSISWGWGLSRWVVDKDVPEFSRGMVSGIKCLRSEWPRHGIRISSLATARVEARRWMKRAEIDHRAQWEALPDTLLTNAHRVPLNLNPHITALSPQPHISLYRSRRIQWLNPVCTFDMGEGWLETIVAAQSHFFILCVTATGWCQLESGIPPSRFLACFCQRWNWVRSTFGRLWEQNWGRSLMALTVHPDA